jgi:hypothetical protein
MRHGRSYDTNSRNIRLCPLAALWCTKRSGSVRSLAAIITKGLCLGLLTVSFTPHLVAAADNVAQLSKPDRSLSAPEVATTPLTIETQPVPAAHPKRANFEREDKSRDAQHVADWVVDSGDNHGMVFMIVDKKDAKVFAFDADGQLRGAAPALLGLGVGDDTIPGIGQRKLSDVRPKERVTQAGRFISSLAINLHGKDILWLDYESSLSLHRVITTRPQDRRLERLATPTPLDNRISFGCINVPVKFFDNVVNPAFTGTSGVVYVLPEIRSNSEIFPSYYDVDLHWGTGTTANLDQGTKVGSRQ